MLKIRKGDLVQVTGGDDKGKRGKVLYVFREEGSAIVEGINFVKKHKRRTQQDQQKTGIVSIEAPISIAHLLPVCKQCDRPVRVGIALLKDGSKSRFCKVCKQSLLA